jgi:ribonuclease I
MFARIRLVLIILITALPAMASNLQASRNGDFSHYTLALAWQPGFCKLSQSCQMPPNSDGALGLLGLWPSLPASLQEQGVNDESWRLKSCFYFSHSVDDPQLSDEVQARLAKAVPKLLDDDLISSEFVKHAQCFGFAGNDYFAKALQLRQSVLDSPFGSYLKNKQGSMVDPTAVRQAFTQAFGAASGAALSLRCLRDAQQRNVLTSLEIQISAQRLNAFPAEASLWHQDGADAPDTCYGPIWIAN